MVDDYLLFLEEKIRAMPSLDHLEKKREKTTDTLCWKAVSCREIGFHSVIASSPEEAIEKLLEHYPILSSLPVSPLERQKHLEERVISPYERKIYTMLLDQYSSKELFAKAEAYIFSLRPIDSGWEVTAQVKLKVLVFLGATLRDVCCAILFCQMDIIVEKVDEKYIYIHNYMPVLGEPWREEGKLYTKIPL